MARPQTASTAAFLIVGVGLLAGAAYAYELIVRRPASWPQADALVVSSRVINPGGPTKYAPEFVVRLQDGGSTRDVRIAPSWRSNSYDMVRGHVARFPEGSHVRVAVNPENATDVRYDLTLSMANLIVPGTLGLLGLVFTVIGGIALRAGQRAREESSLPPVPENAERVAGGSRRVARRASAAFVLVGLVLMSIGGAMAQADLATLREWPEVEARVIDSRVVPAAVSSRGRGRNRPSYDASVTFRYVVNGVTLESSTTYGVGSSQSKAEARARFYSPGTTHRIWHRPDEPRLIRFDLDNTWAVFFLPGAITLMGVVFLAFGALGWRMIPRRVEPIDSFE